MSPLDVKALDPTLREFLEGIVRHIYRVAEQSVGSVRDAAQDENPTRLQDVLVEIQGAVLDRVFTCIDGQSAPSHWPEIELVNLDLGSVLSGDLANAYSLVEGCYLTNTNEPG